MHLRLTLLLALPAVLIGSIGSAVAQQQPATSVVELFTSQGCSSCPVADALLVEYSKRPDVVALSYSVDYWDYLGWKDTLASPRFTYRQKAYAEKRGDGNIYTPQVIVNGLMHAVGSNKDEIDRAVSATTGKIEPIRVSVSAHSDGKTVAIETQPHIQSDKSIGGTVWMVVVQPSVEVEIGKGENKGKRVTYTNVVRELTPVGVWSEKAIRIEVKEPGAVQTKRARCAILLQEGKVGPIVGATWLIGPTQ